MNAKIFEILEYDKIKQMLENLQPPPLAARCVGNLCQKQKLK